jgi:GDSL-like Lipase/Acylhydrolase
MQSVMNFASRTHDFDRSRHEHSNRKHQTPHDFAWSDSGVIAATPPIVPMPALPESLSIDFGNLLSPSFFAQASQFLITAYDAALTQYPEIFIDLGQIIRDLPTFDFTNPLTIALGNTLSDRGFDQLVVFGDSLSDTGNLSKGLGGQFPPSPPFFNGRFSDGPLWLEYLAHQPSDQFCRGRLNHGSQQHRLAAGGGSRSRQITGSTRPNRLVRRTTGR